MKKFTIKTIGCKANQYEADKMNKALCEAGCTPSRSWNDIDIIIVNTCAVTHIAERKSRQFIRKAAKQSPEAKLYITGCATKTDLDRLKEILEIDFIYYDKKSLIENIIKQLPIKTNHKIGSTTEIAEKSRQARREEVEHAEFNTLNEYERTSSATKHHTISPLSQRTRAHLMIQDGCENFCSYCIIPHVRGGNKPRPLPELEKEIAELQANGTREIVLTGINLGMYNWEGHSTVDVCRQVLSLAPDSRLRIGSIEPNLITAELIELISREPRMCKHLHIPLQAGADNTLKNMNRKYLTEDYYQLLGRIRSRIPDISITTDLIVGFPEENETDFNETLLFIQKCNFAKIHIFPYSKRTGTPAALMAQTEESVVNARFDIISVIEEKMRHTYTKNYINKTLEVLTEQEKKGQVTGYSSNYLKVIIPTKDTQLNQIYNVTANRLENDALIVD